MYKLQTYIAYLLLVLFCRIATPEVALLMLHQHEHSEDVVATGPTVEEAHQHCHVDDLYDNGFLLPVSFALEPIYLIETGSIVSLFSFVWKFTFPHNTYLRGPPVA